MLSNKGKSCRQQATLFQTWGYPESNRGSDTASSSIHGGERQGISTKSRCKTTETNQIVLDDDLDGLSQCFNDDNELDLYSGVSTDAKKVYLDEHFNPATSPECIPGFDLTSGHNYIYPVNYPVREYQFDIIMKVLMKNTLVVLPTGLGKTFIAAVVMYNFYRWYPQGKIIFMAPTKPLVSQQIQACYDVTGTPIDDTAEMTGSISPSRRKVLWEKKRVFFLTPHVLQNDLGRGACFADDIVCLVFDEAHKALGNYPYCQVIKEIAGVKSNFRVLALSATPGGDMNAVQQIVTNLMISHVELRSEESPDIRRYVFGRDIEKIVVPLTEELKNTRQLFIQVLEGLIQRLCTQGVCWQRDATKVSKFFLLKARDQFRARGMEDKSRVGMIEGDFALAISLYHAYELLQQHGILSFYNFLKEICCGTKGTSRGRSELMRHEKFMEMMEGLQQKIEPPDDADGSVNSSFFDILTPKRRLLKSIPKPNSLFSSHPKLKKLEEIVIKHFESTKENSVTATHSQTVQNTRVMIFSQYRDSVQEITAVLNKHQPLIKVMSFVGQNGTGKGNRGLSQKEQLEVVQRFKQGGYNVLVSTSVGEEGLDIGDIDLIVCFDASNSPIRLVQRMGRTGRKRAGRIIILVTEGKEDQIYKRSVVNKRNIHKKLLDATKSLVLYDDSPRMIPKHLNPFCLKMQITVEPAELPIRGIKRKSNENKSKKISRKKLDQCAVNGGDAVQPSEEKAGKQINRKKYTKKSVAEKRLDKAKAWRRSTIQKKRINFIDDDDYDDDCDDFQVERVDRDLDANKACIRHISDVIEDEQSSIRLDREAEGLDLKYPTEIQDDEIDNYYGNGINVENALVNCDKMLKISKNDALLNKFANDDDDFICTQNISNFLPSSTPDRNHNRLSVRTAGLQTGQSTLKMGIPSPPKFGDLDDILDKDLQKEDLLNDSYKTRSDKDIDGKYKVALSNCNSEIGRMDSNQNCRTLDCNLQEVDHLNKSDGIQTGLSGGIQTGLSGGIQTGLSGGIQTGVSARFGLSLYKSEPDTQFGDISNLDLFGDSLIDDYEDDIGECPSPPVVTQSKMREVKDREKRAKTISSCLDTSNDMLRIKLENTQNISKEFCGMSSPSDDRNVGLFGLYDVDTDHTKNNNAFKEKSFKGNSIGRMVELDCQSPDFEMLDEESNSDSPLPILSLKSRIRNRHGNDLRESAINDNADLESNDILNEKKHTNEIFDRQDSSFLRDRMKGNNVHRRRLHSPNKMVKSNVELGVKEERVDSSEICNRTTLLRVTSDHSHSSVCDREATMPPLVTRIANRNGIRESDGTRTSNTEEICLDDNEKQSTGNGNINARQVKFDLESTRKRRSVDTDSHIESDSPKLNNNRRRRKAIGRITDDSPSPKGKNSISRVDSSDDEFDNCILRRRKTKTVGVFVSPPPVQGRTASSDEDFECARNSVTETEKSDGKVLRSNGKIKEVSKKKMRADFIDDEAELSGDDSGDEVYPDGSQYVMDSFIDDATQLTQETPPRNRAKQPADMAMIYRQSLFSPMYGALNFRTPNFKANRNRYKMVDRNAWHQTSGDDDEAEEANSFMDDEGENDENEEDIAKQTNGMVLTDECERTTIMPECDTISPPYRKRKSRVKRILSSDDEEPVVYDEVQRTPKKDIGAMSIVEEIAGTKTLHVNGDGRTDQMYNDPYTSSCSDDQMDRTEMMLFSMLNSEDFVPCFDFGLDLGPPDLETSEERRQVVQEDKQEDTTKKYEKRNLFVFASSRVVACSQVGSILRLQHHVQLTVCSQLGCDFVVSRRMGVLRKLQSDISNGSNSKKVLASINEMTQHYGSTCVIIEKDRNKGTTSMEKTISYTKYFTGLLAYLAECRTKVLFSDSQEDTALLICQLAKVENEAEFGLNLSSMKLINSSSEQLQKMLITIPYISYPLSLRLSNEYRCLKPLIKSSVEEIKARIPEVSTTLAKKILQFFQHKILSL